MFNRVPYPAGGIRYAADEPSTPIVITITRVNGQYHYQLDGPSNLAHISSGRFDTLGDRSECEAATLALKSLTPGRTWQLRTEMFADHVEEHPDANSEPPKLVVIMRTSSPTFFQMGEYFSANRRVQTKGGRLIPSMRALHTQLMRFDVRWELIM